MTALRLISTLLLAATAVGIGMDARARFGSLKLFWGAVRTGFGRGWMPGRAGGENGVSEIRRLSSVIVMALIALLALTGFIPVIIVGQHLTGTLLLVHITAAPLFAVALALASLLWAHRLRLEEQDLFLLSAMIARPRTFAVSGAKVLSKVLFWLILIVALPLMLSIILMLFPWFGTDASRLLLSGHGASAVALTVLAMLHTYVTILQMSNPNS
jgi:hypothetical protein